MFKAMIMLTRRADMSHEEFTRWWLDEHVPLASALPNVRKVILNVVDVGYDEAGFDGISELWFDSQDAFEHIRHGITPYGGAPAPIRESSGSPSCVPEQARQRPFLSRAQSRRTPNPCVDTPHSGDRFPHQ